MKSGANKLNETFLKNKGKFIAFIISILVLIAGVIGFSAYRSKYVTFKDPIIETSARGNLNKGGRILKADAEKVRLFRIYDATMQNLTTLEDLKYFPNIVFMGTISATEFETKEERTEFEEEHRISRNVYEKYAKMLQEVLPSLEKLQGIFFCTDTIIFDMTPFLGADQIEELRINTNQIEDLTGIEEMESLRILDVYDNKITDISPLGELENLEALDIRGNPIENIDVLLELPELKVLFYKAESEEQEEVLQELSDRGCTVIQEGGAFLSTIEEKGIESVDILSLY